MEAVFNFINPVLGRRRYRVELWVENSSGVIFEMKMIQETDFRKVFVPWANIVYVELLG